MLISISSSIFLHSQYNEIWFQENNQKWISWHISKTFVEKWFFRSNLIFPSCRTSLILYSTLVICCMLTRRWPHHPNTVTFSRGYQDIEDETELYILFPNSPLLVWHLSQYSMYPFWDTYVNIWKSLLHGPDCHVMSIGSLKCPDVWEVDLTRTCWAPNYKPTLLGNERGR